MSKTSMLAHEHLYKNSKENLSLGPRRPIPKGSQSETEK